MKGLYEQELSGESASSPPTMSVLFSNLPSAAKVQTAQIVLRPFLMDAAAAWQLD